MTFQIEVFYPRQVAQKVIFAQEGQKIVFYWDECNEEFASGGIIIIGVQDLTYRLSSLLHKICDDSH